MMRENRTTPLKAARVRIEKRGEGDDARECFVGYSAVFYREDDPGTEYWLWDDYVERIRPGCFDRALSEKHDARGLFNHDGSRLLGRVSNGTCILSVDDVGLRFEIPYDENDPDHVTVRSKIARGDLTGCSFAFSGADAEWEELDVEDELGHTRTVYIRWLTDLNLHDVGPVTWPAYEATECGVRTAVSSAEQLVEARSNLSTHRKALTDQQASRDAEAIEVNSRWIDINE